MLASFYDPYRSITDINKASYNYTLPQQNYNYAQQSQQQQQPQQQNIYTNQMLQQQQQHNHQVLPQQHATKWASSYQINSPASAMPTHNYHERENESSGESYYSNSSTVLPKIKLTSATPTPKKMLTSSFSEQVGQSKLGNKSRSPQRIYKTHSDLNKEKRPIKKGVSKKDEVSESKSEKKDLDIKNLAKNMEIENSAKKENGSSDVLNQILKRTQNIETNVMVANHKLMMVENRMELVLANQTKLLSRVDNLEKELKSSGGLAPEMLREIKDALNIDFDIDLEIKPDEKINKYSINSIKAYKSNGNNLD